MNLAAGIPLHPLDRVPAGLRSKVALRQVWADVHTHVFTKDDVPDQYLGIRLPLTERFLGWVENRLHRLNRRSDNDKMSRLAYFIRTLNSAHSRDIYALIARYYPSNLLAIWLSKNSYFI